MIFILLCVVFKVFGKFQLVCLQRKQLFFERQPAQAAGTKLEVAFPLGPAPRHPLIFSLFCYKFRSVAILSPLFPHLYPSLDSSKWQNTMQACCWLKSS